MVNGGESCRYVGSAGSALSPHDVLTEALRIVVQARADEELNYQ